MQQETLAAWFEQIELNTIEYDTNDLPILTYMAEQAFQMLEQHQRYGAHSLPMIAYQDATPAQSHRIVTYARPMPEDTNLPFVGFISCRDFSSDNTISSRLTEVDRQMVHELSHMKNLLSYSSLQLHDGNWCNLVVFTAPQAHEGLLASPIHQFAAHQLAPFYYRWIRLHHGIIPMGKLVNGLELSKTKYYTFVHPGQAPLIQTEIYDTRKCV